MKLQILVAVMLIALFSSLAGGTTLESFAPVQDAPKTKDVELTLEMALKVTFKVPETAARPQIDAGGSVIDVNRVAAITIPTLPPKAAVQERFGGKEPTPEDLVKAFKDWTWALDGAERKNVPEKPTIITPQKGPKIVMLEYDVVHERNGTSRQAALMIYFEERVIFIVCTLIPDKLADRLLLTEERKALNFGKMVYDITSSLKISKL
ncbi:hypothetical protein JNK13_01570 [bacterium]|nr:hypothetical protein [bacterium]